MLFLLHEATLRNSLGLHGFNQDGHYTSSPWQNGYIESFNSRFRDECLNREWLLNLREARVVIEDWRQQYNTERPHSRLGYLGPEEFIQTKILTS